jgi:hypothetical protein
MVTAAVLAGGAALTFGQGGTSAKPIAGCADRGSGKLRVLDADERCRRGERRLTWNRRGRRGPAGAQGTVGTTGAPGVAGAPGARGPDGSRGTFAFDSFDGMQCVRDNTAGTIDLTYDAQGFARFTC